MQSAAITQQPEMSAKDKQEYYYFDQAMKMLESIQNFIPKSYFLNDLNCFKAHVGDALVPSFVSMVRLKALLEQLRVAAGVAIQIINFYNDDSGALLETIIDKIEQEQEKLAFKDFLKELNLALSISKTLMDYYILQNKANRWPEALQVFDFFIDKSDLFQSIKIAKNQQGLSSLLTEAVTFIHEISFRLNLIEAFLNIMRSATAEAEIDLLASFSKDLAAVTMNQAKFVEMMTNIRTQASADKRKAESVNFLKAFHSFAYSQINLIGFIYSKNKDMIRMRFLYRDSTTLEGNQRFKEAVKSQLTIHDYAEWLDKDALAEMFKYYFSHQRNKRWGYSKIAELQRLIATAESALAMMDDSRFLHEVHQEQRKEFQLFLSRLGNHPEFKMRNKKSSVYDHIVSGLLQTHARTRELEAAKELAAKVSVYADQVKMIQESIKKACALYKTVESQLHALQSHCQFQKMTLRKEFAAVMASIEEISWQIDGLQIQQKEYSEAEMALASKMFQSVESLITQMTEILVKIEDERSWINKRLKAEENKAKREQAIMESNKIKEEALMAAIATARQEEQQRLDAAKHKAELTDPALLSDESQAEASPTTPIDPFKDVEYAPEPTRKRQQPIGSQLPQQACPISLLFYPKNFYTFDFSNLRIAPPPSAASTNELTDLAPKMLRQ